MLDGSGREPREDVTSRSSSGNPYNVGEAVVGSPIKKPGNKRIKMRDPAHNSKRPLVRRLDLAAKIALLIGQRSLRKRDLPVDSLISWAVDGSGYGSADPPTAYRANTDERGC
jgi:hypothetical protein